MKQKLYVHQYYQALLTFYNPVIMNHFNPFLHFYVGLKMETECKTGRIGKNDEKVKEESMHI